MQHLKLTTYSPSRVLNGVKMAKEKKHEYEYAFINVPNFEGEKFLNEAIKRKEEQGFILFSFSMPWMIFRKAKESKD